MIKNITNYFKRHVLVLGKHVGVFLLCLGHTLFAARFLFFFYFFFFFFSAGPCHRINFILLHVNTDYIP